MYWQQLTIEAVVVGLVFMLMLALVQRTWPMLFKVNRPWTQVFVSAVLAHLAFEFLGLNRWYCSGGAACS